MTGRAKAGGKAGKARGSKAAKPKRRAASATAPRGHSSNTDLQEQLDRRTRERDEARRRLAEALEQQTATSAVLRVISSSPTDLEPVFQVIAESAARLCNAYDVVIWRPDGNLLYPVGHYGPIDVAPLRLNRGTPGGRTILDRETLHISDLQAEFDTFPEARNVSAWGLRALLCVPLMREGLAVGVIAVRRREAQLFTDKQVDLVRNFAAQAVIAIENARLLSELREALQQQTATSEVLQVISSTPGELDPVFRAMLKNAIRVCNAGFGMLTLRESDGLRIAAFERNVVSATGNVIRQSFIHPHPEMPLGRVFHQKTIAHVPDAKSDPSYIAGIEPFKTLVDEEGARSVLVVPMLKEDELVGTLSMYRPEVAPFNDKQIELLQNFAAQAVIAIENTRLLNELRQRTDDLSESLEQQTATSEVLSVISKSPGDLEPVFQTVLENAVKLCEAKFAVLFLFDGTRFRAGAMFNVSVPHADYIEKTGAFEPPPGLPLARLVETKKVAHMLDDPERLSPATKLDGARTHMAVPMLKENKLVGAIYIYRQEVKPFADKQIELVSNFATQAVIAIENTRLLNELRQRTDDLSEALDQQTATSEVLEIISSSAGELEPVFSAMLANATRICEAAFGSLLLYESGKFRRVAIHNAPPAYAEHAALEPFVPQNEKTLSIMQKSMQAVHIVDMAAESPESPIAKFGGARSFVTVPMNKDGELIGVIGIYRHEIRPFSEKQIELLTHFAAQAAIAIENTRLLSELRESLQQQTATADVLKLLSRSTFDLQTVLNTLTKSATQICNADKGAIMMRDGDVYRIRANYGFADEAVQYALNNPLQPNRGSATGRAALEGRAIHIPDALADPEYRASGYHKAFGYRSMLSIPLLREGTTMGTFTLTRDEVNPFTEKQKELATTFADQAVIAIENVRLLDELRQRTDELGRSVGELRALGEVSQAVNSTLDLETVLSTIVAKAVQLSGTEAGAIYVFDDRQREFHLRATYGMDQELIDALARQHIGLDEPNVELAFARGEPIQVSDLREDAPSAANEIVLRAGYRARLVAPLLRGENVIGMLVVRRKMPGAFPESTVELIKTFATQSVLAIQNARLFASVESRTSELAKSLEDLQTAQDRLVQTQKLASLGQLTAGIAHEIKNPLNFVNNFSSLSTELLDELQEALRGASLTDKTRSEIDELTETLRANLDKIEQHGKRADSIVKNMLMHSREGSGEHRLIDINAVVEESLNLAYHGARAEKQGFNITMERAFDLAIGEVDVFPQDITRVLLNLIANGFYAATKRKAEAADEGYEPTLKATTKSLGDRVEIRIRDNGTGIPPEVKEKMFNPFFTTKPPGEGTGLGLSLSHDIIVKQHAGTIEVDTEPGQFTEIRIILPRTAAFIAKTGGRA